MGFFDSIKRAMGFDGYGDGDMEVEGIDATVTPLRERGQRPDMAPERQAAQPVEHGAENSHDDVSPSAGQSDPQGGDDVTGGRPDPSLIFERVVEVFNTSLPDFLQKSVDPARERRELYEALDASMKEYFERQEKNAERRIQGRYQADSLRLQEQIDELRQKARREEEVNSNAKNLQLSAERQKRALSERVHELEKQLATIEAENEQYILENKTMANKLRLATMSDREVDDRQGAEAETHMSGRTDSSGSMDSEKDAAAIASLEAEVKRLQESLEQAKAKDELSRAMVNDLNGRLAETGKIAADREERISVLETELRAANEQLAAVGTKLAKAQNDLQIVREVQEQVKMLEENQRLNVAELRRQKDELLEKDELLRAKNADLLTKNTTLRIKDETIHRLEDQADSLRKSIETVQFEKSQVESALMSEIERLKSLKGLASQEDVAAVVTEPVDEVPSEPEMDLTLDLPELAVKTSEADVAKPKPRRGRPPKPRPAVDPVATGAEQEAAVKSVQGDADSRDTDDDGDFSLLDSTDWLVATPPADPPTKTRKPRRQKAAEQSDDAFGYKEPVRQEPPDNPAQMLLW